MKIYLVLTLDYEGGYVEGVFSSHAGAQRKLAELQQADPLGYCVIDIWELDGAEVKEPQCQNS